MSDSFYDDLSAELKAAEHNPSVSAHLVAIVQAKALIDIATSLAILADVQDAAAPVAVLPVDEQPETALIWTVGDRVRLDGQLFLVDDLRLEQGSLVLNLLAETGNAIGGWTYASAVEYVDHPTDARHDEDGDLQGTEPAAEAVGEVSAVAAFEADEAWPDSDEAGESTDAIAKLRAASKKKPKKA